MTNTPQSNRLHVGIFGETNVGKSTLFNALTDTDIAIVSDTPGTTTDYVQKALELLPFGPIVLIDTAGLGDNSPLGQQRMEKTRKIMNRVDFAIFIGDGGYQEFAKRNIPHIKVQRGNIDIPALKKHLTQELASIKKEETSLLGGLLPSGATILMVAPIDSGAPKGRLILPQAQLIRDCLDNGFMTYVVTENEIKSALANLKKVDLVVTDSQIFGLVAKSIPQDMKLTSFSILMARQKGDIHTLLDGIKAIEDLKDHDKVLISEVCTHNQTHEDIGRVKIPAALRKLTGKDLEFEFSTGRDYTDDPKKYALIVHCGACMITPTEMQNRINAANAAKVGITNYGLLLAYANGILERSIQVLQ